MCKGYRRGGGIALGGRDEWCVGGVTKCDWLGAALRLELLSCSARAMPGWYDTNKRGPPFDEPLSMSCKVRHQTNGFLL